MEIEARYGRSKYFPPRLVCIQLEFEMFFLIYLYALERADNNYLTKEISLIAE